MLVRFAKIDASRYRLSVARPDGTAESRDLEARSYLPHDLMHFVVESEAKLQHSFFGRLAAGAALARASEMGNPSEAPGSEADLTEKVVGAFQGLAKRRGGLAEFLTMFADYLRVQDCEPPSYLSAEFVARVLDRYGALMQRWRNLAVGGQIALEFPD